MAQDFIGVGALAGETSYSGTEPDSATHGPLKTSGVNRLHFGDMQLRAGSLRGSGSGTGLVVGASGATAAECSALQLASYTTANKANLTPSNGMMIYNSSTAKFELYENSSWVNLGGATPTLSDVYDAGGHTVSITDPIILSNGGSTSALRFNDDMYLYFGTGTDVNARFSGTSFTLGAAASATPTSFSMTSGAGTGVAGAAFTLSAGLGGNAATGQSGGAISVFSGAGGNATSAGQYGGYGGNVALAGGAGGTSIDTYAGGGGNITITGGNSGLSGGTTYNNSGGSVTLTSGDGYYPGHIILDCGTALHSSPYPGEVRIQPNEPGTIKIGNSSANPPTTFLGSGMVSIDSYLALAELGSAPSTTAGYGKVYTKSSDSLLYYKTDGGTEYKLSDNWISSVSLDSAYNGGSIITVDTGDITLNVSPSINGMSVSYASINSASDIKGIALIGATNAGAGDSVGILADSSWDFGAQFDSTVQFSGSSTTKLATAVNSGTAESFYANPSNTTTTTPQIHVDWASGAYTGSAPSFRADYQTMTSLSNAGNVNAFAALGKTNAGAGDMIGFYADGNCDYAAKFDTDVWMLDSAKLYLGSTPADDGLLYYDPTSTGYVRLITQDIASGTNTKSANIFIYSGDRITAGTGGTGAVYMYSGSIINSTGGTGTSGAVRIWSGDGEYGTQSSGQVYLQTGGAFETGQSATMYIETGWMWEGYQSGTIYLRTGDNDSASGTGGYTGSVIINSGNSERITSGAVSVFSGNSNSANAAHSTGRLYLFTGANTNAGYTGYIDMYTGNSTGLYSGPISIHTGTGATSTGAINIYSGGATSSSSGNITIYSGNSASGASGNIQILTGSAGTTKGYVEVADTEFRVFQASSSRYAGRFRIEGGTTTYPGVLVDWSSGVNYTGACTPHGVEIDYSTMNLLNSSGDVYGVHLKGRDNIGSGSTYGIFVDSNFNYGGRFQRNLLFDDLVGVIFGTGLDADIGYNNSLDDLIIETTNRAAATASIQIITGATTGTSVATGDITIASGVGTSGTTCTSGAVSVKSGDTSTSTSGSLTLGSGDATSGATGNVTIKSGTRSVDASNATGQWIGGSGNNPNNWDSGQVLLASGTADDYTGNLTLRSGDSADTRIPGTAVTGTVVINSGSVPSATTGPVNIYSGFCTSGGVSSSTGAVNIQSGNNINGSTGNVTLKSGQTTGSGNPGNVILGSGTAAGTGTPGYVDVGGSEIYLDGAVGGGATTTSRITVGNTGSSTRIGVGSTSGNPGTALDGQGYGRGSIFIDSGGGGVYRNTGNATTCTWVAM